MTEARIERAEAAIERLENAVVYLCRLLAYGNEATMNVAEKYKEHTEKLEGYLSPHRSEKG